MAVKENIPVLDGWESLPVAAARLKVTRQRVFQMGAEEGTLTTLHQIPGAGDRPAAYVVATAEVDKLVRDQEEAKQRLREQEAANSQARVAVPA